MRASSLARVPVRHMVALILVVLGLTAWTFWPIAHDYWIVRGLIEQLKAPDARVRASAVESLGKMGPRAARAVPTLIEILLKDDENVRHRAATALAELGDVDEVAPALIESLDADL